MSADHHDLDRPVADHLAGDLDRAEREAFERQLESDDDLRTELAWWEAMAPALRSHGRPTHARPPGPGMLAVVRRRAAEQEAVAVASGPRRMDLRSYAGWAVAAAAGILLAVVLLDRPAPPPDAGVVLAYAEDGSAQVLPASVATLSAIDRPQTTFELAIDRSAERSRRPWLGVWTNPVALKGFERARGLQVVRVASGSPAASIGVVPGDILLDLDGCEMATRYCIARAIRQGQLQAGDTASLRFWRQTDGEIVSREITLGCCVE